MALHLTKDDITQLDVDAIVNAANSSLLGGGAVDDAIQRVAGPDLLADCRQLGGCEPGDAKITKGYGLKARYVIHTVGPVWQGGDKHEAETLASCYKKSLQLAVENKLTSVAFPAISCGIYGYPMAKAAQVAVQICRKFLLNHSHLEITFCLFSETDLDIYKELTEAKAPGKLPMSAKILGGLYGSTVGDALGLPVKFVNRDQLKDSPVHGMLGHGTHNQPPGTWSADTSLSLGTISSLLERGFDLADIMKKMTRWIDEGYLTAHGECFDIGHTIHEAIKKYKAGRKIHEWGCKSDWQNSNRCLVRVLPMILYTLGDSDKVSIHKIFDTCALTHAHPRSKIACAYFNLLIRKLFEDLSLQNAMAYASGEIDNYMPKTESDHFTTLMDGSILTRDVAKVDSSAYVIHTLEAAVFCIHKTKSFTDAVLMAVNLGDDADTTGFVTGALAGLVYGKKQIPAPWIEHLANLKKLEDLYNRFSEQICHQGNCDNTDFLSSGQ